MKNSSRKVLIITPFFPPKKGGAENYCFNIAKGLKKKYGWKIIIVTSGDRFGKMETSQRYGFKIYQLPTLFTISNTPINPLWYFYIKNIISLEKPSIINAHSPVPFMADIAAVVSGQTPFLLTYHSGTMKKDNMILDPIIYLYENFILSFLKKKSLKIICSSDFCKKTMFEGTSSKTITITPGVDLSLFKHDKKIKRHSNSILFVARYKKMFRMKGLFLLLKTMKRLPKVKLRIIGEKMNLRSNNVTFLGVRNQHEIVKEMQQTTALILPSLPNKESFGTVLAEAMACKTPVIATNIGGIPEVISNGIDGILIPANNSKALISAVNRITLNKKLALKLGENGFKKARRNFSWDLKTKMTHQVFIKYL